MPSTIDKAYALIASIEAAMKNGVQHFDIKGKELRTVKEVLLALKRDGKIEMRSRERKG